MSRRATIVGERRVRYYPADPARPRSVFLIEVDALGSDVPFPKLPSEHFVCLVVCDASASACLLAFAETLLDAGAVYVCAWGRAADDVEDATDHAIVLSGRESGTDDVIMTTAHQESLEGALWYALYAAVPAPAYAASCSCLVLIAVDAPDHVALLSACLEDPAAFDASMVD
ncbi:MAG: hypothetical protein R3B72_42420 [Polyangiaceae bacterium]